MNYLILGGCAALWMCSALSLKGQSPIDLSQVVPPSIHYLQMSPDKETEEKIRINNLYLEENGIPQVPVMGEFHYSRMNPGYWKDALLKMKASGVRIVSTYCLWSLHEEQEGQLSWENHLNLRRFIELCQEVGLKVHLRIGPYCNAEIRNGGLPDWLIANKSLETRSNHPLYLAYVQRWYEAIYQQVKGLFYKDGGPVMAIQLENEYVKRGQIIPHLMTLKKMAIETGIHVPLYTMTHWLDSEYPKGEIVPYAGFYIEAPWTTSGKNEMPVSNFEFFTYNRLSDNIGTDIIKVEGEVESLSGKNNDSPFFTCEVGVGSTTFYHRRAIVPEEMAGENINLRLGCGANLMGYYMYTGGSNPVGQITTFQSSGPRISYDYQAPIRETGTLGAVMPEVKKYNYFMNDFGSSLAPAVAYLPTSNQERDNLQWAVRLNGSSGYLFCSNYLYRRQRKDFHDVQFQIRLKEETLRIPRQKITVRNGSYFLWPFNQNLSGVLVKYATAQPICSLKGDKETTYFFFENNHIPTEFLLDPSSIKKVRVKQAKCRKENNGYFIDQMTAGKECLIEITLHDGKRVRLVTLTEKESDQIWKGKNSKGEFVALTESSLIYDDQNITLIDNCPTAQIELYGKNGFVQQHFQATPRQIPARIETLSPFTDSKWIAPTEDSLVQRQFVLNSFADVEKAWIRYTASAKAVCRLNDHEIKTRDLGIYHLGEVTEAIRKGSNTLQLTGINGGAVIAGMEILMKNGERKVWCTDATWTTGKGIPVKIIPDKQKPNQFAAEEHLGLYAVYVPRPTNSEEETRMYISYKGNVANLYQNGHLKADSYYDGTPWIVSLNRLNADAETNPLLIRIEGLSSADAPIYFEKHVDPATCVNPVLNEITVKQEYRFKPIIPD